MVTELTPTLIEALAKGIVSIVAALGAVVATIVGGFTAFYTWKTRYELDQLYALKYRPNEDGTPGPMRRHPTFLVNMFKSSPIKEQPTPVTEEAPKSE